MDPHKVLRIFVAQSRDDMIQTLVEDGSMAGVLRECVATLEAENATLRARVEAAERDRDRDRDESEYWRKRAAQLQDDCQRIITEFNAPAVWAAQLAPPPPIILCNDCPHIGKFKGLAATPAQAAPPPTRVPDAKCETCGGFGIEPYTVLGVRPPCWACRGTGQEPPAKPRAR